MTADPAGDAGPPTAGERRTGSAAPVALPEGTLLKSRVVEDPREPLAAALDREVTGYLVLEGQQTLLLDADGRAVLTLHDGVPRLAYYTGTDRGGPAALADLATTGPYRVELYELDAGVLEELVDDPGLRISPGAPAERLAGDPALATSTRRAAPDEWAGPPGASDGDDETGAEDSDQRRSAVEAFLDDAEKIEVIREQAREEAQAKAEEWGFAEPDG